MGWIRSRMSSAQDAAEACDQVDDVNDGRSVIAIAMRGRLPVFHSTPAGGERYELDLSDPAELWAWRQAVAAEDWILDAALSWRAQEGEEGQSKDARVYPVQYPSDRGHGRACQSTFSQQQALIRRALVRACSLVCPRRRGILSARRTYVPPGIAIRQMEG